MNRRKINNKQEGGLAMDNSYGRAQLVGYSSKINEAELTNKQKQESRNLVIAALVAPLIIVAAFQIAAFFYTEFSRLAWLILGIVLGIIIMIALLVQSTKRKHVTNFEGELVKKQVRKKSSGDPQTGMIETYYLHSLIFRDTKGKTQKYSERCATKEPTENAWSRYLQIGDKVRYHAQQDFFEKYDKSNDALLPCVECRTLFDIALNNCPQCNTTAIKP